MAVRTIQTWGVSGGGGGLGAGPMLELTFADHERVLTLSEGLVAFDVSGGSSTVFLPASAPAGQTAMIKRVGSAGNTLTVDGNGSTIEGLASFPLGSPNMAISLIKRSSGWSIW
jgi:hypothetical protein